MSGITPKTFPTLMICSEPNLVRIKVNGRAGFTNSVDFKTVVTELRKRGTRRFLLDLTDCATMDSTFLGVLAGLAMNGGQASEQAEDLELINPNPRVVDLLDNLGISHLFQVTSCTEKSEAKFEECESTNASKRDLCAESLKAHELLIHLNPSNANKFKDVTEFLAEDLKKLDGEKPNH